MGENARKTFSKYANILYRCKGNLKASKNHFGNYARKWSGYQEVWEQCQKVCKLNYLTNFLESPGYRRGPARGLRYDDIGLFFGWYYDIERFLWSILRYRPKKMTILRYWPNSADMTILMENDEKIDDITILVNKSMVLFPIPGVTKNSLRKSKMLWSDARFQGNKKSFLISVSRVLPGVSANLWDYKCILNIIIY